MKIRGCLWKPGINGLGVGPQWLRVLLPYRKQFDTAARIHDDNYDHRGDSHDRFLFDKYLLDNMLMQSSSDLQVLFAILYYILVRLFGWMFYRYNR